MTVLVVVAMMRVAGAEMTDIAKWLAHGSSRYCLEGRHGREKTNDGGFNLAI